MEGKVPVKLLPAAFLHRAVGTGHRERQRINWATKQPSSTHSIVRVVKLLSEGGMVPSRSLLSTASWRRDDRLPRDAGRDPAMPQPDSVSDRSTQPDSMSETHCTPVVA